MLIPVLRPRDNKNKKEVKSSKKQEKLKLKEFYDRILYVKDFEK